jgi:hypothetical protein
MESWRTLTTEDAPALARGYACVEAVDHRASTTRSRTYAKRYASRTDG